MIWLQSISPLFAYEPKGSWVRILPAAPLGPTQPANVKRGNWIQTMPGKGCIPCLRFYGPLDPFFAKTWRPSEVERVN